MRNGLWNTHSFVAHMVTIIFHLRTLLDWQNENTFQTCNAWNHNMAFNGSLHGPSSLVQHTNLLGKDVIKFPSVDDVGNWAGPLCPAYNHSTAITGWLHLPCTHMPFIFMCLSGTLRQKSPFFSPSDLQSWSSSTLSPAFVTVASIIHMSSLSGVSGSFGNNSQITQHREHSTVSLCAFQPLSLR